MEGYLRCCLATPCPRWNVLLGLWCRFPQAEYLQGTSLVSFHGKPSNDRAQAGGTGRMKGLSLSSFGACCYWPVVRAFLKDSFWHPKLMPFSLFLTDKRALPEFWGHTPGSSVTSPGAQGGAAGWENSGSENPAPEGPSSELQGHFAHGGKATHWLWLTEQLPCKCVGMCSPKVWWAIKTASCSSETCTGISALLQE